MSRDDQLRRVTIGAPARLDSSTTLAERDPRGGCTTSPARVWRYVQEYADAKGPIAEEILARATLRPAIISEALKPDPSSRDTP
jgi:hypothetical protein